jgi:crotonobetainyl-CoA:carnitine CoA-transferase CaiB-like acyl-CoA transferase
MFAAQAILAALYRNTKDGTGQSIDIALLDSQIALMAYVASNYLISNQVPQRLGNAHPNIVPYEVFKAKNGYFTFGAGNDGQWKTFCDHIGHSEWASDERFATNPQRVRNRHELIEILKELFLERDIEDWLSLCESIGLPAAPIHSMDQVFADPQSIARDMRVEIQHPTAGTISLVGSPHKIPTAPPSFRYPPPLLGQHTEEILHNLLGYETEAMDQLRKRGVV